MSTEFELLKYMIDPESDEDKKAKWVREQKLKELEKIEEYKKNIEEWERIKKDIDVLNNSGILSLFVEIRDKNLVEWQQWCQILSQGTLKTITPEPARVYQHQPYFDNINNKWCGVTGIEIRFNGSNGSTEDQRTESSTAWERYSKVEIIVKNEKFQILKTNGDYEPVEKDNIIPAISRGIKEPFRYDSDND